MPEPTCRVCYAKTLTNDERDRFYAEPVTTSIYLCPKHQRLMDEAIAEMPPIRYIKATTPARFATSPAPTPNADETGASACQPHPARGPMIAEHSSEEGGEGLSERESFCVCNGGVGPVICPGDTHTWQCSELWRRVGRVTAERDDLRGRLAAVEALVDAMSLAMLEASDGYVRAHDDQWIRVARNLLASDWLAALLDRERRAGKVEGLREAADQWEGGPTGQALIPRWWLRDRADRIEATP